jgi:hypothetical protein
MRYRSGPRTLPPGNPPFIWESSVYSCSNLTSNYLLCRENFIIFNCLVYRLHYAMHFSIVECLCLKSNWLLGINLLFLNIGWKRFKRSFSKTFDITGKRLMGRYNVSSLRRFFGFRMRTICATFYCAEKYPFSMTALNNCVRYFIPIICSSLRILPVTR